MAGLPQDKLNILQELSKRTDLPDDKKAIVTELLKRSAPQEEVPTTEIQKPFTEFSTPELKEFVQSPDIIKAEVIAPDEAKRRKQEFETALDELENREALGVVGGTVKTVKSAGKQLFNIGQAIGFTLQDPKAALDQIEKILDENDGKTLIKKFFLDKAELLGYQQGRQGLDIDVLIKKVQDEPISVAADLYMVGALAKKPLLSITDKVLAKKMLIKNGDRLSGITKIIKTQFQSLDDQLIAKQRTLRKFFKQEKVGGKPILDQPDFIVGSTKSLGDDLLAIKKSENIKLDAIIARNKDLPIDKQAVLVNINKKLAEKGLLTTEKELIEGGAASVAKQVPVKEIAKSSFYKKLITRLEDKNPLKLKEAKIIMNNLDDSINYVTPKVKDSGIKIGRAAIREEIGGTPGKPGGLLPEYGKQADKVHDRLVILSNRERQLQKVGGKAKTVKRIFDNQEELDSVKGFLEELGTKQAEVALGKVDALEALWLWNRFTGANESLIPAFVSFKGVPIRTKGALGAVQRGITRTKITKTGQATREAAAQAGKLTKPLRGLPLKSSALQLAPLQTTIAQSTESPFARLQELRDR